MGTIRPPSTGDNDVQRRSQRVILKVTVVVVAQGSDNKLVFEVTHGGDRHRECTRGTEAAPVSVPLPSNANSVSGTVNHVKPQSKQTKSFGNIQTVGLSRLLRPRKWTLISELNSASLPDAHIKQGITNPTQPGAGLSVVLMAPTRARHEKVAAQMQRVLSERASELCSESRPSSLETN